MTLEVLHVDNHVLAVRKPAGLPVVPDETRDESLLDQAREWVRINFAKPGEVFLGVVHRLDRPVSGVVVFGRTSKGASRLTEAFRSRATRKQYLGLAPRAPVEREGELVQWLLKNGARKRVAVVAPGAPGAKEARTQWRVLADARAGAPCVLLLEPLTGRAHQLRVACRALGTPLLGDLRYGADLPLPDRSVALHAWRLVLPHPTRPEPLALEAALPELAVWDAARTTLGERGDA